MTIGPAGFVRPSSRVDLRGSDVWVWVEDHFRSLLLSAGDESAGDSAAGGRLVAHWPSQPRDPSISADGTVVACTVALQTDLESAPTDAVLLLDRASEQATVVRLDGSHVRRPRFAPSGARLAVLLGTEGRPALVVNGEVEPLPVLPGVVESVDWSPDGEQLSAVVADPGADAAGAQGSGRVAGDRPDWAPHVLADEPVGGWRRVMTLRVGEHSWREVSSPSTTNWEAVWCGTDHMVTVCSDRPDEAAWFGARVDLVSVSAGAHAPRTVFEFTDGRCVGVPAVSQSGRQIAIVVATCSDRTVVAGDVYVADLEFDGVPELLDLGGIDVTSMAWIGDERLVVVGQRSMQTVIAELDVTDRRLTERWRSETLTCGQRYPEIAVARTGDAALVLEGYGVPPELAVLGASDEAPVALTRLTSGGLRDAAREGGAAEIVRWSAPDGLEIEGLVVVPDGPGPFPMVTYVHGGPVWAWRSRWSMGYPYTLLLARAGIAVFHPNPRGSSGRGEQFRSLVIGDLGGAECGDLLSGIDALVDQGIADPDRLGVIGGSHGGFIAAQLVTVTDRFRAAVSYCPVTQWPFMCLTTNDMAAQDRLLGEGGAPSPLDAVDRVTTPTLVLTGSQDLITPASQGLAFHRALVNRGVPTEYAEYPLEGHGVRSFPAQIDFSARVLDWFVHWFVRPS